MRHGAMWLLCAWVLWGSIGGKEPIAVSGHPAFVACENERQWRAVKVPEATYQCLPDTVDPRGPKR